MLAKLKDYFINQFRFSSRLTGLNDSLANDLPVYSGLQINMLSKVFAWSEIAFLGQLADYILIVFIYLSTVSFETANIIKQFLGGGGLYHPPFPNLLFLLS